MITPCRFGVLEDYVDLGLKCVVEENVAKEQSGIYAFEEGTANKKP